MGPRNSGIGSSREVVRWLLAGYEGKRARDRTFVGDKDLETIRPLGVISETFSDLSLCLLLAC
jgi:hypothetical protein